MAENTPEITPLIEDEYKALVDDWRGAQRQLAAAVEGGDDARMSQCREIETKLYGEIAEFRRNHRWR